MDNLVSKCIGYWASFFHSIGEFFNQFNKQPDRFDVKKPDHWKHWGGEDDN